MGKLQLRGRRGFASSASPPSPPQLHRLLQDRAGAIVLHRVTLPRPDTLLSLGRTVPVGTVGWNSRQDRARQG